MRTNKIEVPVQVDAVSELGDKIEVRIENRNMGRTLYVHVNGVTIVRIGNIRGTVVIDDPVRGEYDLL